MRDEITKRYGLHLFLRSFLGGIFLISFVLAQPVQAAPLNAGPTLVISGTCDLRGNSVFIITNIGDAMTVNYTWEIYQESAFLTSGPFMLTAISTPGATQQITINGLYGNLTVGIKDNNGVQITSATAFCENHPTVTINQAAGQADPGLSSPINFTARFSVPVTGFDAGDVAISGMSTAPGITVTDSGDHKTYNIAITGMILGETVIATIPANAALSFGVSGAGYGNQASTSTDNRITYQGPPVLGVAGTCDNGGNSVFTITNIGGTMTVNYTWEIYQESAFLTSGPFMLTAASTPGATQQITINGLYGNLTVGIKDNNGVQITSASAFCPDYRPTVTINQAAAQPDPTNSSPIRFDVVFSAAVTGFTNTDVRVSGMAAAPGITVTDSGDHIHYTVAVTGVASGETVTARIIQNAATESHGAGNLASTSADNSVTYETARPSVTINQAAGQADPTNVLPILFEITFSEQINPTTFTSGDVFVTGAASYSVAITDSGDHIHFTVAVSGISNGTTITAQIPVNMVSDRAGNLNFASTSTDNKVTYNDTTPPSVTVEQAIGQPDPTSASTVHFTVIFSEPIKASTFTSSDITLGGTTGANLVTISQLAPNDGTTFDIAVSGMTVNGDVMASIPAGNVNDLAGNSNSASTSADNTVTFDNKLPSVTVEQAAGQTDPTNTSPINFTATFSQPIDTSTFTASDITLGGTANPITAVINEIAPSDGTTFNIAVSGMTGNGTVTASITVNTVQDLAGKNNTASTSADNTVTYDTVGPTVRVEQSASQLDPTAGAPIEFTATFSKPINLSTFNPSDITLGGSANPATAVITELAPNDGTTFRIQVSGMTSSGLVTASISSGKVADVLGNLNAASTSTDNTVTYDAILPGVTVEQASGQVDPTNATPINFTATFSKPIAPSTFTSDDVTLIGSTGAMAVLITEIAPNNGTKFNIQVSGMTSDGTITASISANKVQDSLGNANTASTSVDNSVTYDTTGQTVTVEQAAGQADPTNISPIHFTVSFNEPINLSTFTSADITLGGTAGATTVVITEIAPNNGTTFDIEVSGMATDGMVTASLAANVVQDATGNGNDASTSADNSVTYDTAAPTVQVEQAVTQPDPTNAAPIHFTVIFNEPIDPSTFTSTDITFGGTASATTAFITEIAPNDGTTFDIAVSGMTASGPVTASIGANNMRDLAGNFNAASTSVDNTVTFDQTLPMVSTTSLLASYDTTGPGTFTITFNKEVNDPAGDSDAKDVTNPDNYLIVEKGVNGTFDTQSCIGGVQSDDVKVAVASVMYINPTAIVKLASPLAAGNYRLFVCGTTSILDLSGNHLGGGVDYTFDFTVTATTENPSTNEEDADIFTASSLPKTGFAPDKITSLPTQPATLTYAELGDLWLEIPSLNVKSSIVGVPQNKDNSWDVTWLGNDTGWLNGTAFPTWTGNSVLTAHVTNASGLEGPFAALKQLKYGDQIIVHMGGVKYVYEIRNSRLARPYSTSFAFESLQDHSYLTLITCQGYNPINETYLFRRVLRAVLVNVENK